MPLRKGGVAGRVGRYCEIGWQCFSSTQISSLTNFVALPGLLGRELRGAPMGDALSGAVLRLFKWERESSQRPMENKDTVSMRSSCSKLVHFNGSNMLVLDVSFRDDLRMFCIWGGSPGIGKRRASQWATARLRARHCSGTMALEEADSRPSLACVLRLVLMAYWLPWLSLTHLVHPCITLLTSVSGSLGRLGIPAPRKWLSSKDGFAVFSV